LKTYSSENYFQISAYNLGYAALLKEADLSMNKQDGHTFLSDIKTNSAQPEYKKLKKTNPMYKFFKLEYLKSFED